MFIISKAFNVKIIIQNSCNWDSSHPGYRNTAKTKNTDRAKVINIELFINTKCALVQSLVEQFVNLLLLSIYSLLNVVTFLIKYLINNAQNRHFEILYSSELCDNKLGHGTIYFKQSTKA